MSWEMRLGDSLSAMRGMDSSSIDVVLSDPPYDAGTHAGVMSMKGGAPGEIQLGFEALSTMQHVREMLRVARRWVLAFCALEQLGEYQLFSGDHWVRAGVWDRISGAPQLSGDRPAQGCDGIAIMYAGGGRMQWNGGGSRAIWRVPRANGEHHPTEKPIGLMEMLVRQFTNYGETILDPFAGSGTTGVAAVRLGRSFIGYEMLDEHHKTAIARLTGTKEQMDLLYKPKKKEKQLKLEASHGKEEGEEDQAQGLPDHGLDGSGTVPEVPQRSAGTEAPDDGRDPEVDRRDEIPDRDREDGDPFTEEDHTEEGEEFGAEDRDW